MIPRDPISRRQVVGLLATPLVAPLLSCRQDFFAPRQQLLHAASTPGVTLIGAGDPHCVTGLQRVHREKTAAMVKSVLDADSSAIAFNAGDLTHKGTLNELTNGYEPSWGQFRDRTLFAYGNHDRYADTSGATFFNYTGSERYYARNLGDHWRLYVLCCESVSMGGANANEQTAWLKADIAQHSARHIMAMWHYPLYSNVCAHVGKEMTWPGRVGPWWQVLEDHGAEFVISGHVHRWERFARVRRTGLRTCVADPDHGMREFVMGTGGGNTFGVLEKHPNCERTVVTRGVVRFDLSPDSYGWNFTDTNGSVRDQGSQACRKSVTV